MPIFSLDEGQQMGKVRGVVVDPDNFSVVALVTDKQSWFGDYKVIPYENVVSIGEHAVTIDKKTNMEKPSNIPQISKLMKKKVPLMGGKVISESGTLLGIVEEFSFDTQTGKIKSIEVSGKFIESFFRGKMSIPASSVITIGTDAIIVSMDAQKNLKKLDSPLKKKLNSLKSSGKRFLGSTKEKTKKWSDSLNNSLEKFTGSGSEQETENQSPHGKNDDELTQP